MIHETNEEIRKAGNTSARYYIDTINDTQVDIDRKMNELESKGYTAFEYHDDLYVVTFDSIESLVEPRG